MPVLDHEGLLTLARKAFAAAIDADTERVVENLAVLTRSLPQHLDAETPTLTRLAPAEARLLRRGQARVSAAVRALDREAVAGCGGPPGRCAAQAEELVALLTLQARDERLAHRAPGCEATSARRCWR